jgi:hypothetical protein
VILQEGSPSLGGRPAPANDVFADAGLADIDGEFEEFAVDARSTPEWIFAAHLADQITDFYRNAGPSDSAATDLPGPEEPKALAVPADDSLGLDDDEGRSPIAVCGGTDSQPPTNYRTW